MYGRDLSVGFGLLPDARCCAVTPCTSVRGVLLTGQQLTGYYHPTRILTYYL
jgi:hypothetical protein